MNSYEKYLKYKNKYINLKNQLGGIVGQIPKHKLAGLKIKRSIPQEINKYVNMITVPNSEIIRVGSSSGKIQPFFSDVDIMNIIEKPMPVDMLISYFITQIKNIVEKLRLEKKIFFSDFKAGGIHWTIDEILNETKDNTKLSDACKVKDVIKLDIIGPYEGRYLEMSTFFILKSNNDYINVTDNYFSTLPEQLLKDIDKYKESKPFKAIKRVWSYARIQKNDDVMDKLQFLIKSNIALLAQINADIETIQLLIEHNNRYDVEFVINELDGFKERLSNIIDIEYDELKLDYIIDYLITLFNVGTNNKTLLDNLEQLHTLILDIINKETKDYLKSINFTFPTKDSETSFFDKIKKLFM